MVKVCSQKGEMERAENARTDQEMEIQSEKRTEVCERRHGRGLGLRCRS